MNRFFRTILLLTLPCILLTSCGGDEDFTISCKIEGIGEYGIEMIYAGRNGLSRRSFHPVKDEVELRGESVEPTLVEAFSLDGTRLFTCVAQNGDHFDLTMKLGDPASVKIKGQDASRDFAAFTAEHDSILTFGPDEAVNALIAEAVRSNPNSMASTLLMVTRFRTQGHEMEADSLLRSIKAEARPRLVAGPYASALGEQVSTGAQGETKSITLNTVRDTTTVRFYPHNQSYSLLIFNYAAKPDSVSKLLRSLRADNTRRRLGIFEISLAPDSTQWRSTIDGDSATWIQAWVAGGSAAPPIRRMAVPRTPFYIVADSTGAQRYRGTSLSEAVSKFKGLDNIAPFCLAGVYIFVGK